MWRFIRRISLTQWIVVSMFVGVGIGFLFPAQSQELKVVSNIFIKLIKCIIVPIIFSTLVVGIAGHTDDLKAVGRLALKSIIYFEIVTTLALAIGLLAVNVTKPGRGVSLEASKSGNGDKTPPMEIHQRTNTVQDAAVTISPLMEKRNAGVASFTIATAVATNGTISISGTNLTFTPAINFMGRAIIGYTVIDETGQTNSAIIAVNVGPKGKSVREIIEHIVPQSFFESAANNEVLQVVTFAIIFALALTQISGKPKETMLNFFEGLSEVMFKFTGIVMKFAPVGIGAAMAVTVGHGGLGVLGNLAKLVLTLYAALLVFVFAVLLPVALMFRIPIFKFLKAVKEPALIAFSTTSSDAALPDAFKKMIAFGVPKRIVSFVLPTGYSFNLDGSTLYLAVASIFVAQAAGVHQTLGQQLMMMLTLMLTSKGVAAVPRASLVILSGTLVTFGLPLEGVAVILGVDELMDMARTTVNLVGNCLASAVMARSERELKTNEAEAVK